MRLVFVKQAPPMHRKNGTQCLDFWRRAWDESRMVSQRVARVWEVTDSPPDLDTLSNKGPGQNKSADHWNGDPLDSVQKALGMAGGMTCKGVHPRSPEYIHPFTLRRQSRGETPMIFRKQRPK
jgi:hypothetical protein